MLRVAVLHSCCPTFDWGVMLLCQADATSLVPVAWLLHPLLHSSLHPVLGLGVRSFSQSRSRIRWLWTRPGPCYRTARVLSAAFDVV